VSNLIIVGNISHQSGSVSRKEIGVVGEYIVLPCGGEGRVLFD